MPTAITGSPPCWPQSRVPPSRADSVPLPGGDRMAVKRHKTADDMLGGALRRLARVC
jgi:hypothetical protein